VAKIILNISNLVEGGSLQVSSALLEGLKSFPKHEFFVFLPDTSSLKQKEFPSNFYFYHIYNYSPFNMFNNIAKYLSFLEDEIKPDCVLSIFGPTYWKPKTRHVMGFAQSLYLYSELPYLQKLSFYEKFNLNIRKTIHRFFLKNNCDLYIVQASDMIDRLSLFLDIPKDKILASSGSYHPVFKEKIYDFNLLPIKKNNEFRFITISSYYPHKNLEIINKVVELLAIKDLKINIKFVLTLPHKVFKDKFKNSNNMIINIGPVSIDKCPYLYSMSDALFLPTLVESFTASYPEAMIMKKPILTSDYSFAKSVCKESALYFNPYDVEDIVSQIIKISTDKNLYKTLSDKGFVNVQKMPSVFDMTKKYLDACLGVVN